MPKRRAETDSTPVQRKTHLGFKEMASEEDWKVIHSKTQKMLISNAQEVYNSETGQGAEIRTEFGQPLSPAHEVGEETGYKQSSLLDHFKVQDCSHGTGAHKQGQELISPSEADSQVCAYCLKPALSPLSPCSFCERSFCPSCLGRCSRCLKPFCSVCSQTDYSGEYETLLCLSCASEDD